jgi:hypothetical protein
MILLYKEAKFDIVSFIFDLIFYPEYVNTFLQAPLSFTGLLIVTSKNI